MNAIAREIGEAHAALVKADPASPCLKVLGRDVITIKAGTSFNGHTFANDTALEMPKLVAGRDYIILVDVTGVDVQPLDGVPDGNRVLGGFHFAPGGNATARAGGDNVPAINSYSLWDQSFRPSCPDPRGMTLVGIMAGSSGATSI